MALLDFLGKKNKGTSQVTQGTNSSTASSSANEKQKIILCESKEDLQRVVVNLSKEKGINFDKLKMRVAIVMDHSGSMDWQYNNGNVQNILTRLLPFALQFDDNGQLEVYLFDDVCIKMDVDMTEENYSSYVDDVIKKGHYNYGGTRYAPAIQMTDEFYNDDESKTTPTLVFFITDGDNSKSDRAPSDKAIIKSSKHGIFYMFIGTSKTCDFEYLRHLDDLDGRKFDNTGFMSVKDLNSTSNGDLFMNSLKDFSDWLKAKGYVK